MVAREQATQRLASLGDLSNAVSPLLVPQRTTTKD